MIIQLKYNKTITFFFIIFIFLYFLIGNSFYKQFNSNFVGFFIILFFIFFLIFFSRKYFKIPIYIDTDQKTIYINNTIYKENYDSIKLETIESFIITKKKFVIYTNTKVISLSKQINNLNILKNFLKRNGINEKKR